MSPERATAILAENAQREAAIEGEANVVGSIAPIDPADIMVISGWAGANRYTVDEVWTRGGQTYAAVSPRYKSPFDPPDVSVWRFDRATTTMEAVAWVDGTKTPREPECSICRGRHPSDDRHAYE